MATRERAIEKFLVERVNARQGMALKLVPFGLTGIPDRLIILPGPRLIFVEVKRPVGGRISPHQHWWRERLLALGCEHAFVRSREEVEALIGSVNDARRTA